MAADIANFDLSKFLFTGVSGTMVQTFMFVIVLLVFIGLLGAFAWWWKTRKKYDIKVRIYSTRYGSPKTWDDWGAIYKDKKTGQANGFKLKSEKDIISPPPYSIMMMAVKGNVIHMKQDSTGHFTFLEPDFITDDDKVKLKIVREDIRLWQSAQRQQIDILYTKKNWYDGLLAFLPYVITAVLILILIYTVLQKFEVLRDVAGSLNAAAQALKDLHSSGALVTTGA